MMNMMKYLFLNMLFVSMSILTQAQDLLAIEDSIAFQYTELSKAKSDTDRDSCSQRMRRLFIEAMAIEGTFEHSFEKLKFSKITSSDNKVRLFNWNQPNDDGTFKYYCFVLRREVSRKGQSSLEWFELEQAKREVDKVENKFLNADKWLGALYYDIIPVGKKNVDTYVVLGWEGKDDITTRKIIDAITFTGNKVRLGAAIFKTATGTQKRMIYEYSNDISMSIKYYAKKGCIVMDHLSPKSPAMQGVWADYGPDGTYCMFKLDKDKWEFFDEIDISQFIEDDDRPYFNPRPNDRRRN